MATTDKSKVEQLSGIVHGHPYRSDHLKNFSQLPTADNVEEVFQLIRGYKSFYGKLTGVNADAPTLVTLRNELGATPTVARTGEGVNTITFGTGGLLTADLTGVIAMSIIATHDVLAVVTDTNVVTVTFTTKTGNSDTADDMGACYFEIRVYGV